MRGLQSASALVLGLGAMTMMGCAASAVESDGGEQTGQSEEALTLTATPIAPPPKGPILTTPIATAKDRRVIRQKGRGCQAIVGIGGSWTGAALHGPFGTSKSFCTYEWTPTSTTSVTGVAGKSVKSDVAALERAAVRDTILKKPYVLADARKANSPLGSANLTSGGGDGGAFTGNGTGGGGGGVNAPPTNLIAAGGGDGYTHNTGTFDLTAIKPTKPAGWSGCDVCDEDVTGADSSYLLFVLPPDAVGASNITLETASGVYDIGGTTDPFFYTPVPPTFSFYGVYYVSWW